jgi:nucleoside-diphosphate-sugar epimerase
MRVFVTGATGAVGPHAVRALLEAGHQVTALVRSAEKRAQVEAMGATPAEASLFDRVALAAAFADHDAVANLATHIPSTNRMLLPGAWKENGRIREEGSAAVVDAALDAGVGRLVQESVVMIYADQGDRWVDEDAPVDDYPIARMNLAAEASARRFTESGGTGVVLRFGLFYGPGAGQSEEMMRFARRHVGSVLGSGDGYLSSIHVADAGAAVAAALHVPAGTWNVVDDEPLTKHAYADAMAEAVGVSPWVRSPGRLANLLGDRLTAVTRSVRAGNLRFKQATGWTPRYPSAREGLKAMAEELATR